MSDLDEQNPELDREATSANVARDLGVQPLERLMQERGLRAADLVAASGEQITHRMVARAARGRRLTARTMAKVHRAWNKAAETDVAESDLFNYRP